MDNMRGTGRPKPKRKNKFGVFILVVFLLGLLGFTVFAVIKYMPSFTKESQRDYYGLVGDKTYIVLEDNLMSGKNPGTIKDGEIYLPVDFIKEFVDEYIFWDDSQQKLTITTQYKLIQMKTEELTYYLNMEPMNLNIPIYNINGIPYMPKSLIDELYNLDIEYMEDENLMIVDYKDNTKKIGTLGSKKTQMRFEPDRKSNILSDIEPNEEFVIYKEVDDYYYIRNKSGLLGYILKDKVEDTKEIAGVKKEEIVPDYTPIKPIEGRINLVWDAMENVEQNHRELSNTYYKGMDVVSPQWFRFDRDTYNGDILSIADNQYVKNAHDNGVQVWAMLSDSEDGEITAQILSDTNKREHVIKQLLAFISLYDLDGINIDFERVREDDVEYFHQFLRELSPMLKQEGVSLSVDVFVPRAWSMYYNREEIAKSSDYICVMSYDENTYGDTSGPNASLPFVEEAIVDMLKEVPSEKLLMGIPSYSRVWIESQGDSGIEYTIRSLGMNYARRLFEENGAEFRWIDELGCYYAEFDIVEEGKEKTYRTWLEDEESIIKKLELIDKYDLAGTAMWVRGLEKPEIWEILENQLKDN